MANKIAYTDRYGVRAWLCTHNEATGNHPMFGPHTGAGYRWSSLIADAAEFVDDAAITAFLAGKDVASFANGQIVSQVAGVCNYSKGQH